MTRTATSTLVVTDGDVSPEQFSALQAMHDGLAATDSAWAIQLEGVYVAQQVLSRPNLDGRLVPNIERGQGEQLKMARFDLGWEVHRVVLRNWGVVLAGPPPQTFVAPVSPARLRQAMRFTLSDWAAPLLTIPHQLARRGYQSFVVLSLCRILYTLRRGEVVSKPAAASWAQEMLGQPWASLIDSAWAGRHQPDQPSLPEEVDWTLAFIWYTLDKSLQQTPP